MYRKISGYYEITPAGLKRVVCSIGKRRLRVLYVADVCPLGVCSNTSITCNQCSLNNMLINKSLVSL